MLLSLLAHHALAAQPKKRPEDAKRGEDIWERSCWQCHGEKAQGDGPAAASMAVPVPVLVGLDPDDKEAYVEVILKGRGDMPAYGEELDKHDARRIMTFLASLDEEEPEEEESEEADTEEQAEGGTEEEAPKDEAEPAEEPAEEPDVKKDGD